MRFRLFVPASICVALFAGACGSTDSGVTGVRSDSLPTSATDASTANTGPTDTSTTDTGSNAPSSGDPFGWQPSSDGVETGHLKVPIDYNDPSKGDFNLYVARHKADPKKRIGSLLVNPGGPGFGGSELAIKPEGYFSPDLIERFDIIG